MYAIAAKYLRVMRGGTGGRFRHPFLSAFLTLAVAAGGLSGQLLAQSSLPSLAPLNPAFLVQVSTSHAKIKPALSASPSDSPLEHTLGGLTPPLDMSHMRGQHPKLSSGAHVQAAGYASSYDLRTPPSKVSPVKNQGTCGACWTFGTMASLESRLLTGESWDFSEENLKNTSGFDYDPCTGGGEFIMSTAYLSRWSGPWNEADAVYTSTPTKQSPLYPSAKAQKHVQEVLFLPDRGSSIDNDNIKYALTTYGAVQTSIYMNEAGYYNSTYKSYYYSGTASINHIVTIVGWDDGFPAANFKTTAPGDGAFIVKNSWGTGWGDSGYFYISYHDTKLINNTVFNGAESIGNYHAVYQYDPLGQTNSIGYSTSTAWMSNVFTAVEDNTQVSAVSFYTMALNSTYDIYVYRDMPTAGNPRSGTLVSSHLEGTQPYAGYHTIPLATKVPLNSGQKFTVVIRITTPNYDYPIPVEEPIANYSSGATASAGQGYISYAGSSWEDLTTITNPGPPVTYPYTNTNANIKAFTSIINDPTPPSDVVTVRDGAGADISYTSSTSRLSGNWTASSDDESGIRRYWYAIGTTKGGAETKVWTDNGPAISTTAAGLSLSSGATYYLSVKAENWVGLQSSTTTSDGQTVDTSSPAAPGVVYDGTAIGVDSAYSGFASQLSANWTAGTDTQSGIAKYWYAIGTQPGWTELTGGWTDNGSATSVTRAGLVLYSGTTYYFSVKAENGVGFQSSTVTSNGAMVDTTPPSAPVLVNDGTGTDIYFSSSGTQLSANWTVSVDTQSGVAKYWYAISSKTAGGTDFIGWTDNGTSTSATRTGLSLTDGVTYYFTVKAENGAGLQSAAANSNGQLLDLTPPAAPGVARDGLGADIAFTTVSAQLSANWAPSTDNQSGVARYWYAISSTTQGGTEFVGWTNNGSSTSVTRPGLTLADGVTYYFTIKAENGAGALSVSTNTDGQMADLSAPSAPAFVKDGAGPDDIAYTANGTRLSANWAVSVDTQSGVARYWYAIGTTPGGTNTVGWTDNGLALSTTAVLSLAQDQLYFFSVKAENRAGLQSSPVNSDGQTVDISSPSAPGSVKDGLGVDISSTNFPTQLSANWAVAVDTDSGVAKYWYAISSTTPGGTEFADWADNGNVTSVTRTGLTLENGVTYYFTVKAQNGSGLISSSSTSNGQRYVPDSTQPLPVHAVRDGTGADAAWSGSLTQLSANWDAASDPDSGIARYWYAISSKTAGGTDFIGWTDNGTSTSVTRTGLSLTDGLTYYFTVKAENGYAMLSSTVNSNGQVVDASSPTTPAYIYDGLSADVVYSSDNLHLSVNWAASTDPQSGVVRYWYAIGTAPGGVDRLGWTDNGLATSTTTVWPYLALTSGVTYYFSVKAENGAGLQSPAANSDGQMLDTTIPNKVLQVRDGYGADIAFSSSTSQLSANWSASTDTDSGVVRYWYAIGTTAGLAQTRGWTDNGLALSTTAAGLSLSEGVTYYFSVEAENGAGERSLLSYSNGQMVDMSSPSAITQVRDGTGADIMYSALLSTLSANWDVSTDTQSGVARYWYAIGTTTGGAQTLGWKDNGVATSTTAFDLGLVSGTSYYFSVKAENAVGLISDLKVSNGVLVDTTAPSSVGIVRDSTGTDAAYSVSGNSLSANWNAASDSESGVAKYWYGIGTSAGLVNFVGWTDNGPSTSVTKSGLALTNGGVYFFTVKAENWAGSSSTVVNSDGQMVDTSSPAAPGQVNDGTGLDLKYTASPTQLSANWTVSSDLQSGVAKYWYAVGTVSGSTNTIGWTDNGASLSITTASLSLASGSTYYFSVRAQNAAGLLSDVSVSDGQTVDTSSPSVVAQVRDGDGTDIAYSVLASTLSANWDVSTDLQSGVTSYLYAIGTTPGGTQTQGWADNGPATSTTTIGLSLTSGVTYYFSVKAENGVGMISDLKSSNGVMVDTTNPSAVGAVRDGLGAGDVYSVSRNSLSANWDPASDAESGIARYWYAISSTTKGETEFVGWTDNGTNTSVIKSGLTLEDGVRYYFTVKAENRVTLLSAAKNSNGLMVDTSSPTAAGAINDGVGVDIDYTSSASDLSANWPAFQDPQTAVTEYFYAVSTTSGGWDFVGWTNNGTNTSVTLTGLPLVSGSTYYFSVRAGNAAGLLSDAYRSDGQVVDLSAPSAPAAVYDGTGTMDAAYAGYLNRLSAHWPAASDAQSGVVRYWYGIGTTPGDTDTTLGWRDNGPALSTTAVSLSLLDGVTYYFSVKAENGSGLKSLPTISDGQMVDSTPPLTIAQVRDSTGTDAAYSVSRSRLSANWDATSDAETGVLRYWYAIGTTAGGVDTLGWTDNALGTAVTRSSLSLSDGVTYYFSVTAENAAGLRSSTATSNGLMVDASSPSVVFPLDGDTSGTDIAYTMFGYKLSANWAPSVDPHSGVARYFVAIGTTPGGAYVFPWTDNGLGTSVTSTGLTLVEGDTYYFSVIAENAAGLFSSTGTSNGQLVDLSSPTAVAYVNDGAVAGVDAAYADPNNPGVLSASWPAASDALSGVGKYWYTIGTTPKGTDVTGGWNDSATSLSVSKPDLVLTSGVTYYFSVVTEDRAGLRSSTVTSNGQLADLVKPVIGALNSATHPSQTAWYNNNLPAYTWSASDALTGVQGYYYLLDQTLVRTPAEVFASSYTVSSAYAESSPKADGVWYFHLTARDKAGNLSNVSTYKTQVDASSPAAVTSLHDGTAADVAYTVSSSKLSANWAAASDAQSGITRYWYAISSMAPGGFEFAGWTDNGTNTSVTSSGLSLADGVTYYFSVKAENGAGLQSAAANTNGQMVDISSPAAPGQVNDGTGADVRYIGPSIPLSANWTVSVDTQSGVAKYWYAIGTTPGGNNLVDWANNYSYLSVTNTSVTLSDGVTYYFSVKAENRAGLQSAAVSSDGQLADLTLPSSPAFVYDSTGTDIAYTNAAGTLSANWGASSDAQSGVVKYLYAIGTEQGGVEISTLTENGLNTSVTRTGLTLVSGSTYYFTVFAENGAGTRSAPVYSNGQFVDITNASNITYVRDGTGTADINYVSSLDTLSANWAASSHPRGINRYEYAIGTAPGGATVAAWTSSGLNTSVTRTGLPLAEGTSYYFTVRAYPNTGLPSAYANSDGQLTDTIAPSAAVLVTSALPAKAGPLAVKLIVAEINGLSGTPVLTYTLPNGAIHPIPLSYLTGSTWTGSGYLESWFSTGTVVTFVFTSSDVAGNTGTGISSGSTFYMDTSVSGVTGGAVVNSDSTTVILPPGASVVPLLILTSTVPASRTSSAAGGDSLALAGYDLTREFKAQDLSGHAVQSFSVPVTIKMYYPDADNNGIVDGTNISETLVGVYWLDEVSQKWAPVYDGVLRDYAANSVQADVSHFSVYSLRYLDSAQIGTGKVKVYPNPCYMKDNQVAISGIPPAATNVRIYIYDPAGNLVRTLDSANGVNSSNVGTWDGRNSEGRRAASGVYIYVIKTGDMGKGSGKLAIIW